jgi:very-short-patch-repair endonuclease
MAHLSDMRAIAERSASQLGLITSDQLDGLAVTRQSRRTLEERGAIERLGRRVWRLPGHPHPWHQRLLAAVLEAGPDAVVSHLAACAWWRFEGIAPGAVEITVPRGRRPRMVTGLVHHSRDLLAVDVDRRGMIPVTSPSRSLLDAAPRLTRPQLEEALDAAARGGVISTAHLRWRVEELRRRGRPGVGKILDVLPAEPVQARGEESWLEARLLRVVADAGLPAPRCQVRLQHSGGAARVDFFYDQARLVIETDGHGTHTTRLQRQADAERDARLAAEGYQVVRFTYDDVVGRPGYVVSTIRRFLGAPTVSVT